jgi:DNA/RNA-binding domain of Phe-tRNA-synthetase-like protein
MPSPPVRPASLETVIKDTLARLLAGDATTQSAIERYKSALRALGRNPQRYRISSDALHRRVSRDRQLPSISLPVDVGNVLSLGTGWPVGCYDFDKIMPPLSLRVGEEGDVMSSLSKGDLSIAGLPVLADGSGSFGSSINDSDRTHVDGSTRTVLFCIYVYEPVDWDELKSFILRVLDAAGLEQLSPFQISGLDA